MFDNYAIPKDCLLNKNGDVTKEGRYKSPFKDPNKRFGKLLLSLITLHTLANILKEVNRITIVFPMSATGASLGNLSAGRVGVISMTVGQLCTVLPIAIRYSAARRQFGGDSDGTTKEFPVIEYQLQQWRLFPYLAATYVLKSFSDCFWNEFVVFLISRFTGGDDKLDLATAGFEIHSITSSAKPLMSYIARDAIQECREACGGHGYLRAAGIGRLRNDNDSNITYEGENAVLMQQTSNWLLSVYENLIKNPGSQSTSTPFATLSFLKEMSNVESKRFSSPRSLAEVTNSEFLLTSYKWLVCWLLKATSNKLNSILKTGVDGFSAKNSSQAYFARSLSLAFIEHYVLEKFWIKLGADSKDNKFGSNIHNVLQKCFLLYGLWSLEKHLGTLYMAGYFRNEEAGLCLREAVLQLCKELKPEAVTLVDAISPPDFVLNSALGASDGKVYQHLEVAMTEAPGCYEKPSWWHEAANRLRGKL